MLFLVLKFLCIINLINPLDAYFRDDYIEQFQNLTIYEATAFGAQERAVLLALYKRTKTAIFVNGVTNDAALPMNILVHDDHTEIIDIFLENNDIEYIHMNPKNLVNSIEKVVLHHTTPNKLFDFTKRFYSYDDIKLWLDFVKTKNSILKEIVIGQTNEKRDLFVLKISTGTRDKAVVLMGGEEGKDWISSAILMNFVNNILEKKMENVTRFYDFYIIPLANPDGYMYSTTKDRFWSKNRNEYRPKNPCSPSHPNIMGINIDRNWDFRVKVNECYPIFPGPSSLSEVETRAISKFLNKIALRMMGFINIRGFENLVTIPFAHEGYCNNFDVLMDMLSATHSIVQKNHNVTFYYGLTSKYIIRGNCRGQPKCSAMEWSRPGGTAYVITVSPMPGHFDGNVADWVKHHLNTPIVYTFYMKTGHYVLPIAKDAATLTAQLSTMITEILLLANSFYGPLFSNQLRCSMNIVSLIMSVVSCYLL